MKLACMLKICLNHTSQNSGSTKISTAVHHIQILVLEIRHNLPTSISGLILHFGFMRPSTVLIVPMAACATVYQFTSFFNDFGTLLTMAVLSGLFTGSFWAVQVRSFICLKLCVYSAVSSLYLKLFIAPPS